MSKKKPTYRLSPNHLMDYAKADASHVELAKARAETAKWKSRFNEAVAMSRDLGSQVESLVAIQSKPQQAAFDRAKAGSGRGVSVVIPATDWHSEETVSLDATNGKNEFNLDIAAQRVKRFYAKAVELVDWYRHFSKVLNVWHPLLGDLMSGFIHDELVETNGLSPIEVQLWLQEHLTNGIDFLRKETKLPVYVPTCVGNHGRTTIRKRIKTSCRNSYEWLLYKTLERQYASNPNVHWFVGNGYHNIQEVNGRKVRFHHGDGMRFFGGVGGVTIPVNKSIAQWNQANPVDFDIFGHFHTHLVNYPTWISCGSLIGLTEFAVEIKASYQAPTQTFIAIDRQYGLTLATPIFITNPTRIIEVRSK